jgi:hypothetical protein
MSEWVRSSAGLGACLGTVSGLSLPYRIRRNQSQVFRLIPDLEAESNIVEFGLSSLGKAVHSSMESTLARKRGRRDSSTDRDRAVRRLAEPKARKPHQRPAPTVEGCVLSIPERCSMQTDPLVFRPGSFGQPALCRSGGLDSAVLDVTTEDPSCLVWRGNFGPLQFSDFIMRFLHQFPCGRPGWRGTARVTPTNAEGESQPPNQERGWPRSG